MQKPICLLSAVLMFACAAHADAATDQYDSWFTAIGDNPTKESPGAVNGEWEFPESSVGETLFEDAKMVFDLDSDGVVTFTPAADKAPDTNTLVCVALTATLDEVPGTTTPTVSSDAQMAIIAQDGAYKLWNGVEWVTLTGLTPSSSEVTLNITFKYLGSNANSYKRYVQVEGAGNGWIELATTEDNLGSVDLKGSGSVGQISSTVMLGVAQADGVKYGTIAAAVTAASEMSGGNGVVTLLRDTTEEVTIDAGQAVTIDSNGKTSGEVTNNGTIDIKLDTATVAAGSGSFEFYVKGDGTVNAITTTDESKEVQFTKSGTKVSVTVQTAKSYLQGIAPTAGKGLMNNETKFRAFMAKHGGSAYTKANTTVAELQTSVTTNGVNNIPLWQSYVLGIEPDVTPTAIPLPTGDADTEKITLAIPAIDTSKYSGDYTVTYKVGDQEVSDPAAVKVPLTTGTYTIKAVLK